MWIRDSFPVQSINLGARGRFSALGYDAKIHDKKLKTIQNAAEEILNHVKADRPPVSLATAAMNCFADQTQRCRVVHFLSSLRVIVLEESSLHKLVIYHSLERRLRD